MTLSISAAALAALMCCASGCQPQVTQKITSRRPHSPDTGTPVDLSKAPIENQRIRWQVLPCGSVANDSMTLPAVSPDGMFIATQTGGSPSWDQLLARDGATPPTATRIEIYSLREGSEQPQFVAAVDQQVLLGRSVDREGFLVESPREDGSRWIGKADWSTGSVQWLVHDEYVNAFASLGPGGRLAWSRRAVDTEHFDLAVRHLAEPWILEGGGGDWLMPTWAGTGDGLFALNLTNHFLDAVYGTAVGPEQYRRSMRRLPIATDALLPAAFQLLNGHINVNDGAAAPRTELVFYHIGYGRVGVWQPRSARADRATVFAIGSLFGVTDNAGFIVCMTEKALVRQRIDHPPDKIELLKGHLVPRPITHPNWQYLLLAPSNGQVNLTLMRLLPADSPLWTDATSGK